MIDELHFTHPTMGFLIKFCRKFLPIGISDAVRVGGGNIELGRTPIMKYAFSQETGLPLITNNYSEYKMPDVRSYRLLMEDVIGSYSLFEEGNFNKNIFMGRLAFRVPLSNRRESVEAYFCANDHKVLIRPLCVADPDYEMNYFRLGDDDAYPHEKELKMRCRAYMACTTGDIR